MTAQTDPLLDAVDTLTIQHVVTTRLDDGKNHYESHDGLIKQLRDAIASNIGGSAGGKPARERIPLDADALTKYEQMEVAIGERFRGLCEGIPGLLPEDTLRAWFLAFSNAHRAGTGSDASYEDEVRTLQSWVRTIEEKLSAPTVRELFDQSGQPETCPECGAGWYEVILNRGILERFPDGTVKRRWYEKERRIALTASYTPDDKGGLTASFARCGCCGHVWMGSQGIRALAYELEHPTSDQATTA
ncbi:MAG: hypothetical protein JWP32_2864 [Schumannella sp.]|nr:hypothetical protein [Schumannella sp.]